MSCTVRVIYYDNRDSPVTVLPCMCITQETFIHIVMSWYDHYCADANILILSYLPCWYCKFSTIAFIMWKSFVWKFVLLMLNIFILVHKWFIWMVVICHVFYCILCCICIFYHVLCQKWQNKSVKSLWFTSHNETYHMELFSFFDSQKKIVLTVTFVMWQSFRCRHKWSESSLWIHIISLTGYFA